MFTEEYLKTIVSLIGEGKWMQKEVSFLYFTYLENG